MTVIVSGEDVKRRLITTYYFTTYFFYYLYYLLLYYLLLDYLLLNGLLFPEPSAPGFGTGHFLFVGI